ncbi:Protein of unknown function [Lactobacillus pasteurii]|uniref:Uncharacterized protein n=1 Tax=Lactobacillus pasteurii DSM 23907 = CRBIP 24.76 TaxID=1423790 RepID=I7LAB8_9LACO|nr:Protein of unknown function [Lactobacillus pasteurii]CCI84551.1 Protein of unknown function [Lactobacillus pasteurii DSM 23907 = CRBIP 24.76]
MNKYTVIVNEPMMYDMPIVFNSVYAIPFVLTPMVATTLAYIATSLH